MRKPELDAYVNEAVAAALAEQAIRIDAILRHPEAEGRRDLALTLALNSPLSADAALDILKAAPKANANRELWLAAMSAEGSLNLAPEHTAVAVDKKAARLAELRQASTTVRATKYGLPAKK